MDKIIYSVNDPRLNARTFLLLVQEVWPGSYNEERTAEALSKTLNISAWEGDKLVGSVRVLTDGYYFATIPEILVDPDYQGAGIGANLMELAWDSSPTSLFFGAQPGNEGFFEKMGFTEGMTSFQKKKKRN